MDLVNIPGTVHQNALLLEGSLFVNILIYGIYVCKVCKLYVNLKLTGP